MRNPSTASGSKTTACCSKAGMKRGPWTTEEDELLTTYIEREGEGRWRTMPKRAGLLRCGKSCRLRWMNYLRPSLKHGHIAPDEEDLILRLHRLLGNRWSLIAGRIPGRTDNEIKNYWNTHLSKKLISQGIDPRTHKPLNPNSSIIHYSPSSINTVANDHTISNPHPNPNLVITPNLDEQKIMGDSPIIYGNNVDGSRIEQYGLSNEDHNGDDDINCCSDDVFSLFLNSLINDDNMLINTAQQHDQLEQDQQFEANLVPSDPLIAPTESNFAFGEVGWDAPIMNTTISGTAFNQNDFERISD